MMKVCPADLELGLRKNIIICMQSQILKKYLILKFKIISRTCFFLLYALWFMSRGKTEINPLFAEM